MGGKLNRAKSSHFTSMLARLQPNSAAVLGSGGKEGQKRTESSRDSWILEEELITVTSDQAIITWNTEHNGDTSVWFGASSCRLRKITLARGKKRHWAELKGLAAGERYWYQVETNGIRGALSSFRTLPLPTGKHLFSFGIFSDIHLAEGFSHSDPNEIYFGKLVDESEPLLIRCLDDAKARGMELAIFTGDLTDTASHAQLERLRGTILPQLDGVPYYLLPGNHDKYVAKARGQGLGAEGFQQVLSQRDRYYYQIKYKGYQFLLLDSARPDSDWGAIPPAELDWLRQTLKKDSDPAFLFLHHTCNGPDVWFGINNFLRFQKTVRSFPQVQAVFSGHMHRSAVTTSRLMTGQRPYVELPATVQFPCGYGLVRVYENGFQYNVYKSTRLDLGELSRHKVLGGLKQAGPIYTWYSLGGLGDRNFSYLDNTCRRLKQFELYLELDENEALELQRQNQGASGSSVAASVGENMWKLVLGRFDSSDLAKEYQKHLELDYGLRANLKFDGNYNLPASGLKRVTKNDTRVENTFGAINSSLQPG